jgi:hypothetical protein
MKNQSSNQNLSCARVYPTGAIKKQISDLKTVILDLTPEEAGDLASALQSEIGQGGGTVRVVGFRKPKKDGTHRLSVRSLKNRPSRRRESLDEGII